MAHVNRRIGKSSEDANVTADGTGGGVLDAFLHDYFRRSNNIYNAPGVPLHGMVATGGVISDYTDGGTVYRSHIFTSTGTFVVSDVGELGGTIDYVIVGGGAGGSGGSPGSYTSGGVGGGQMVLDSLFNSIRSISFCYNIPSINWCWWCWWSGKI